MKVCLKRIKKLCPQRYFVNFKALHLSFTENAVPECTGMTSMEKLIYVFHSSIIKKNQIKSKRMTYFYFYKVACAMHSYAQSIKLLWQCSKFKLNWTQLWFEFTMHFTSKTSCCQLSIMLNKPQLESIGARVYCALYKQNILLLAQHCAK